MNPSSCSFDELVERLNKLEQRNRWLGRILVGLLAVVGVGLLGAAQGARSQAGGSEALVLRDGAGEARARLEMSPEGPVLRFLDDQGKPLATVGATRDALLLRLFNKRGRLQTGVALENDGVAFVSYDGDGLLQTGRAALLETSGVLAPRREPSGPHP
jgi:hypothetical protein